MARTVDQANTPVIASVVRCFQRRPDLLGALRQRVTVLKAGLPGGASGGAAGRMEFMSPSLSACLCSRAWAVQRHAAVARVDTRKNLAVHCPHQPFGVCDEPSFPVSARSSREKAVFFALSDRRCRKLPRRLTQELVKENIRSIQSSLYGTRICCSDPSAVYYSPTFM